METIFEYAQSLVYTLLGLMPSPHQRSSLEALLGLFLQAQGQAVPAHCTHKSASALSRFLNRYDWSTRGVIRATRQAMLKQILQHLPPGMTTLKVIIDLTTLPKCGKFAHLATVLKSEMGDNQATVQTDPWVRVLNGKRGLHLVMLYLVVGQWRVPWSFCLWHGKGHLSPTQLACKLLARVPKTLTKRFPVIVLADTEFGTVEFLQAVQQRQWRVVVGMRGNRQMQNGKSLKQLYRSGRRGQQVRLVGLSKPLTVSWFWLKRSEGKRELRFVVSTYPYSGVYLVRLGRQRWAIEGFFKTIKHRFSLHRFGQSTLLGLYRWLVLSLVSFVLAHWTHCWARTQRLDWKATGELAQAILLPQVIWKDLLHQIKINWDIAMQHGFEIVLKPIRWDY